MATAGQRRSYFDSPSILPSEWNQYSMGYRSTPFVSTDYDLGALYGKNKPTLIGALFDKVSEFESKQKDKGSMFERFLALQKNPLSIVEAQLPAGFTQSTSLASAFKS